VYFRKIPYDYGQTASFNSYAYLKFLIETFISVVIPVARSPFAALWRVLAFHAFPAHAFAPFVINDFGTASFLCVANPLTYFSIIKPSEVPMYFIHVLEPTAIG
jgi:hypothetical protein